MQLHLPILFEFVGYLCELQLQISGFSPAFRTLYLRPVQLLLHVHPNLISLHLFLGDKLLQLLHLCSVQLDFIIF